MKKGKLSIENIMCFIEIDYVCKGKFVGFGIRKMLMQPIESIVRVLEMIRVFIMRTVRRITGVVLESIISIMSIIVNVIKIVRKIKKIKKFIMNNQILVEIMRVKKRKVSMIIMVYPKHKIYLKER